MLLRYLKRELTPLLHRALPDFLREATQEGVSAFCRPEHVAALVRGVQHALGIGVLHLILRRTLFSTIYGMMGGADHVVYEEEIIEGVDHVRSNGLKRADARSGVNSFVIRIFRIHREDVYYDSHSHAIRRSQCSERGRDDAEESEERHSLKPRPLEPSSEACCGGCPP